MTPLRRSQSSTDSLPTTTVGVVSPAFANSYWSIMGMWRGLRDPHFTASSEPLPLSDRHISSTSDVMMPTAPAFSNSTKCLV